MGVESGASHPMWGEIETLLTMRPNYPLEGPLGVPVVYEEFAAVFPDDGGLVVVSSDEKRFLSRILEMKVPESVRNHRVSERVRDSMTGDYYARAGKVTQALVAGSVRDTGERVVLLSMTYVLDPAHALANIQNQVLLRVARAEGKL